MLRCPVCKADNAAGPQCRRCKADLSLLWELERHRDAALQDARRRLWAGDWRGARERAEVADRLRGDEDSRRVLALASLLGGDFVTAWESYCRLQTSGAV
jgi:hypothetical protein